MKGVAVATTPEPRLASEDVIINAPMSFTGAAQRSFRIARGATGGTRFVLVAFAIIPLIAMWWFLIIGWYLLFGLFLVPYRLLRRGSRKRKAEALRHQEMLEAIQRKREDAGE
jgi:hypothetical protein